MRIVSVGLEFRGPAAARRAAVAAAPGQQEAKHRDRKKRFAHALFSVVGAPADHSLAGDG